MHQSTLLLKLKNSYCVQGWCSDTADCIHLCQFYITLKFYYLALFIINNNTAVCESLKSPTNSASFQLSWLLSQFSITANALTCILYSQLNGSFFALKIITSDTFILISPSL